MQTQCHTVADESRSVRTLRGFPRSSRELLLLAPTGSPAPRFFNHLQADAQVHTSLLEEAQALRGKIYLQDGAITPAQISNGRHQSDSDRKSWHLLILDKNRRVCACSRYTENPSDAAFRSLLVSKAALAQCPRWGARFESAVEQELALVRRLGLSCAEVGGWALSDEVRGSSDAVRMVLTTYGLAQALGGGVGLATATQRNGSASILRRMGARPLEHLESELPSYYDPQYACEMEVLRFYFWAPNPRYAPWIAEIRAELAGIRVITDGAIDPEWSLARPGWRFVTTRSTLRSSSQWPSADLPTAAQSSIQEEAYAADPACA